MSLTDFFERGNPEDMAHDLDREMQLEGVLSTTEASEGVVNSTKVQKNHRIYTLISIVVIAAVLSLGLGIIEGLTEKSAANGLIMSSVPLGHQASSSSAELNADTSLTSNPGSSGEGLGN